MTARRRLDGVLSGVLPKVSRTGRAFRASVGCEGAIHVPILCCAIIMPPSATTTTTVIGVEPDSEIKLRLRGDHDAIQTKSTASTHKKDLAENPFQRVWRGDRQGSIKMPGVPTFEDTYEERRWVKQHMAGCFRYWGKMGFGEGTAGHITVRDPVLTDHYWMNPFGMHFSLIKVGHTAIWTRLTSQGFRLGTRGPRWLRDGAWRSTSGQ